MRTRWMLPLVFPLAMARMDAATDKDREIVQRGLEMLHSGDRTKALALWQQAVSAAPEDQDLVEEVMAVEQREDLWEESLAAAHRFSAASRTPQEKGVREFLVAELQERVGELAGAATTLRAVFEKSAADSWLEREALNRFLGVSNQNRQPAYRRDLLEKLAQDYPRRVIVKKQLAEDQVLRGELDEAVTALRALLAAHPDDRSLREALIGALEGAGQFRESVAEMEPLLAKEPQNLNLWEHLEELKRKAGDGQGAEAALEKALALMPSDDTGRRRKEDLLRRCGRLPVEIVETTPGANAEVGDWLRYGRASILSGESSKAAGPLVEACSRFPAQAELLEVTCRVALASGRPDPARAQAFEWVRLATTAEALDASINVAAAMALSSQDGIGAWRKAVEAPAHSSVQLRCLNAALVRQSGDWIGARKLLEQTAAEDPSTLGASQLAHLLERRGDPAAAAVVVREALEKPTGATSENRKWLVQLLTTAGDYPAALEVMDRWFALSPQDPEPWVRRADILFAANRSEEAIALLRKGIGEIERHEELALKLAEVQTAAHQADDAWDTLLALSDEPTTSATARQKALHLLGWMTRYSSRKEDLINHLERRSRSHPDSVEGSLALAEFYRSWNDTENELACLQDASRLRPEDPALRLRIADGMDVSGNSQGSRAILRQLLNGPLAPEARSRLAVKDLLGGVAETAEREALEWGITGAFPDLRQLEQMLWARAVNGKWNHVEELAAKALQRHPEDWRMAYLRALALEHTGKKQVAFDAYTALLAMKNETGEALEMSFVSPRDSYDRDIRISPGPRLAGDIYAVAMGTTPWMEGIIPITLPGTITELKKFSAVAALNLMRDAKLPSHRVVCPDLVDLEMLKPFWLLTPAELEKSLMGDQVDPMAYLAYLDQDNWKPEVISRSGPRMPSASFDPYLYRGSEELLHHALSRAIAECPEALPKMLWVASFHSAVFNDADLATLARKAPGSSWARDYGSDMLLDVAVNHSAPQSVISSFEHELVNGRSSRPITMDRYNRGPGQTLQTMTKALVKYWLDQGRVDEAAAWLNSKPVTLPDADWDSFWNSFNYFTDHDFSNLATRILSIKPVPGSFIDESADELKAQAELREALGDPVRPSWRTRPFPVAAAHELVAKITEPALKMILLDAAGDDAAVKAEAERIAATPRAGTAALVTAAMWFSDLGRDPLRACELLVRAEAENDIPAWSRGLDVLLLHMVSQAGPEKLPDLGPVQRAALRELPRASGDRYKISSLARALSHPGFELLSSTVETYRRSSSFFSTLRNRKYESERGYRPEDVTEAVADDRKPAAARALLSRLWKVEWPDRSQSIAGLAKVVEGGDFKQELSAAVTPEDLKGPEKRRNYAVLLLHLKQVDAGLPLLEQALKDYPEDIDLELTKFVTGSPQDRQAILDSLSAGTMGFERTRKWVEAWMAGSGENLPEVATAVGSALEKLAPAKEADLGWVNRLAQRLHSGSEGNGVIRPGGPPGRPRRPDRPSPPGRGAPLANEPGGSPKVVPGLYVAMLSWPQTSHQAFSLLLEEKQRLALTADQLDAFAVAGYRARLRNPGKNPGANDQRETSDDQRTMTPGMSPEERQMILYRQAMEARQMSRTQITLRPPSALEEYLSRRLAAGTHLEIFDREFLGELEKRREEPAVGSLLKLAAVLKSDRGEDFDGWLRDLAASGDELNDWLEIVLVLASERQSGEYSVTAAAEKALCKQLMVPARMLGQQPPARKFLATRVSSRPTPDARLEELRHIAGVIMGPPEIWHLYQEAGRSSPVGGIRRALMNGLLMDLNANPSGTLLVSSMAKELGWETDVAGSSYGYSFPGDMTNVAAMTANGVFSRTFMLANGYNAGFGPLLQNLGQKSLPQLPEELLKAEGEGAFWAHLLGSALKKDPEGALAGIESSRELIDSWSSAERSRFVEMVTKAFSELKDPGKGTWHDLREMAAAATREELRISAEAILSDDNPARSPRNPSTPEALLTELVKLDPELAGRLWLHLLQKNGGREAASTHSKLLGAQLRESKISLPALADFLTRLERNAKDVPLCWKLNDSTEFYSSIEREVRSVAVPAELAALNMNSYGPRVAAWLAEQGPACAPEVRPTLAALIAIAGQEQSRQISQGQPILSARDSAAAFIAWADRNSGKTSPLLADAAILYAIPGLWSELDDDGKARMRLALRRLTGSPEIPLSIRRHLLGSLAPSWMVPEILDDAETCAAIVNSLKEAFPLSLKSLDRAPVTLFEALAGDASLTPQDAKALGEIVTHLIIQERTVGEPDSRSLQVTPAVIRLAIKAGDKDLIAKAVINARWGAALRYDIMIELLNSACPEAAAALLAPPSKLHLPGTMTYNGRKGFMEFGTNVFTKSLEASLPALLAAIPDRGQRFRIECLFSGLPDASGEDAPLQAHDARLMSLIARFPADGPIEFAARLETLAALSSSTADGTLALPLFDDIAAFVKWVDMSELEGQHNYGYASGAGQAVRTSDLLTRLLAFSISAPIVASGDTSVLEKQAALLVAADHGKNHVEGSGGRFIAANAVPLLKAVMDGPESRRISINAGIRRMAAIMVRGGGPDEIQPAVQLALAAHLIGGNSSGFYTWYGELPEEKRDIPWAGHLGVLGQEDTFSELAKVLRDGEEVVPIRRKLLEALLSDQEFLKDSEKGGANFRQRVVAPPFDEADLKAVLPLLPDSPAKRALEKE